MPQASRIVLLDDKRAQFVGDYHGFVRFDHPLSAKAAEDCRGQTEEGRGADGETKWEAGTSNATEGLDKRSEAMEYLTSNNLGGMGQGGKGHPGDLIGKEGKEHGTVPLSVYQQYVQAGGSMSVVIGVCGGLLLNNAVSAGSSWWLGYWSDNPDGQWCKQGRGLGIYVIFSFATIIMSGIAIFFASRAGQQACKVFHEKLIHGILRANMSFFDTTPLGRIVNRFSKDVYTLDEQLPVTMYSWVSCAGAVLATVVTIICVTPWFTLPAVILGYVYYKIQVFYIPTARELKRLDSVSRSPIFSQFSACLEGASTIRAFRAEQQFIDTNLASLERNLRAYYLNISSNRWLALRLEFVGTIIVVLASLLAVLDDNVGRPFVVLGRHWNMSCGPPHTSSCAVTS